MDSKEMEAAIHMLARAVYQTTINVQDTIFVLQHRGNAVEPHIALMLRNAVNSLQDVQARVDHLIIEDQ